MTLKEHVSNSEGKIASFIRISKPWGDTPIVTAATVHLDPYTKEGVGSYTFFSIVSGQMPVLICSCSHD